MKNTHGGVHHLLLLSYKTLSHKNSHLTIKLVFQGWVLDSTIIIIYIGQSCHFNDTQSSRSSFSKIFALSYLHVQNFYKNNEAYSEPCQT